MNPSGCGRSEQYPGSVIIIVILYTCMYPPMCVYVTVLPCTVPFKYYICLYSIRSASDMFSFLMSDHRPPPPDIDIDALEVALIHAESQGNTQ